MFFGKKYLVYTPDTNYGINNIGEYLMNGECVFKFKSLKEAIDLTNNIKENGDGRFSLVEKGFNQKLIDYNVNYNINDFDGIKSEQNKSEITFYTKDSKTTMSWSGKLMSENFTDMNSYYNMSLMLPVLKQHIIHYLTVYNYNINFIELEIVKKIFGWTYELSLNISFNIDNFVDLHIQDMFKENLWFGDISYAYDWTGKYKQAKDFYSYYNVACGFALEEPYKAMACSNFNKIKDFYTNCIAKDWEVI